MKKHKLDRSDIMPMSDYAKIRREKRRELIALKEPRRIHIGPYATVHFENYDTMWHQVHEMLYIEKGGDEQLSGELAAYNPLIPNGHELVATVMFEIEDEQRRQRLLGMLGGVEETIVMTFAGERIHGRPETDVDRTSADGKASSVQFLHFPFTAPQIALFRQPSQPVIFAIEHPQYHHMAMLPEPVRATLAEDFD